MNRTRRFSPGVLFLAALGLVPPLLAGCGGGGSENAGAGTGLTGVGRLSVNDKPVASATIRAHRIVCDDSDPNVAQPPCTTETVAANQTTSDAAGVYTLTLPTGTYRVFGSGRTGTGQTATAYVDQATVPASGKLSLNLTFFTPNNRP